MGKGTMDTAEEAAVKDKDLEDKELVLALGKLGKHRVSGMERARDETDYVCTRFAEIAELFDLVGAG